MTKYELYKLNSETGEVPNLPTLTTLTAKEAMECLERMYPKSQFETEDGSLASQIDNDWFAQDDEYIIMTGETTETFIMRKKELRK